MGRRRVGGRRATRGERDVCSELCGKDLGLVTVTDRSRWEGPELSCGWEWDKEGARQRSFMKIHGDQCCGSFPGARALGSPERWGRQRNWL